MKGGRGVNSFKKMAGCNIYPRKLFWEIQFIWDKTALNDVK
jgi:hypothetical protein